VKNPVINNENKLLITADSIKIPDIVLKKHIKTLVKTYLSIKNAFVASNGKDAEKIAAEFLKQLSYIDISLDKNMYVEWLKISQDLKNNLREIIEEKNIDMKRSRFGIVSNLMAEVIESSGHFTGSKIYLEYCPMAFDNKGAYWLSDKKEIENPYFGDKMLRCGEVKKEYN
jgi:Cu(I)/Ag(I) efflux system membrane fusion protein